ncbi:nitroreductase family protein [Chloroflexota bacterium]
MMTLMEAIEKRRSIRNFKPDPVPEEAVNLMLESARLAPSGSNRQPWRFQLITDLTLREKIFNEATFGAKHILEAPLMIVCGSELLTYVKGHKFAPAGSEYLRAENEDWESLKPFIPDAQMNTAIAIEHMVLAATAAGIGTCWVQRIKPGQLAKILEWPRHIVVLTLVLAGYPLEDPAPKPRLPLEEIVIQ